jgi:hypothetical protein
MTPKQKQPIRMWLDQHGNHFVARTVKQAHAYCGGGRVSRMFVHTKDGRFVHVGYIIGERWLTCFVRWEKEA